LAKFPAQEEIRHNTNLHNTKEAEENRTFAKILDLRLVNIRPRVDKQREINDPVIDTKAETDAQFVDEFYIPFGLTVNLEISETEHFGHKAIRPDGTVNVSHSHFKSTVD
jgi:hypothetical protein